MQVVDEEATKEKQLKTDEEAKKEGKDSAEAVEPVMKSEGKETYDWRIQNDNKPSVDAQPQRCACALSLAWTGVVLLVTESSPLVSLCPCLCCAK